MSRASTVNHPSDRRTIAARQRKTMKGDALNNLRDTVLAGSHPGTEMIREPIDLDAIRAHGEAMKGCGCRGCEAEHLAPILESLPALCDEVERLRLDSARLDWLLGGGTPKHRYNDAWRQWDGVEDFRNAIDRARESSPIGSRAEENS